VQILPELPELEAIATRLSERFNGKRIESADVHDALVIHGMTPDRFISGITDKVISSCTNDGKFVLLNLSTGGSIVINPMLAGRFRVADAGRKPLKRDVFTLQFHNDLLSYTDSKRMSRVYLVVDDDFSAVKGFEGRGPSALADNLTEGLFLERFKRFRGHIKNVLTNQRFITGIGNAYADEILLYAGILPFRRISTVNAAESVRLYRAMRDVLSRYRKMMMKRTLTELAIEKRDFLMIHGKGGGICPLCGGRISEVTANRFRTNYCQTCQK
jgi:formamidopyrimidine-DNA glycosylase